MWMKLLRYAGLLAAGWTTALAAWAAPLVTTTQLAEALPRGEVLVIDASPARMHAAGHIPGAVNVDVFSYGGQDLGPAEMEKRIRAWGISPGRKIVLYDQGGTFWATSLYFDLLHYGVAAEDMSVLDGGFAKWTATGGAVTKDPTPAPAPGTFRVSVREDVRVRLPEFLVASGDPANHALVEALEPAQHFGGAKFFDRAGHIPNAILTPTNDFFNADKTFKSPEELKRMFAYLGIRPEQTLHSHCGGGIAASVPFFAARNLMGYPKVKLYKESQLEWLRDDRGLPFWTYDAPNMLRDKLWVTGWNNPMVRMFGQSRLSLVDVRPEAAFRSVRMAHAGNLPAETLRRHRAEPAKLAEAFGAAGVNPQFEAVVISNGLDPDAALAYVLLEKAGQKRVSILPESMDDLAFAGLPVERESDAPDPKKPKSPPPKPTAYPNAPRAGVITDAASSATGHYPRIYLATGKAPLARPPVGKVVHVPYTDLVANGKPKPANDLWTLLSKAGVPRYAEIVAIADDPGEAAMGYVVMKLMGWPDVKVAMP